MKARIEYVDGNSFIVRLLEVTNKSPEGIIHKIIDIDEASRMAGKKVSQEETIEVVISEPVVNPKPKGKTKEKYDRQMKAIVPWIDKNRSFEEVMDIINPTHKRAELVCYSWDKANSRHKLLGNPIKRYYICGEEYEYRVTPLMFKYSEAPFKEIKKART